MPPKEHRLTRGKVIGKIFSGTSKTVSDTIKSIRETVPDMKIIINPVHVTPPVKGGKKTKRRIKRNRKTYRRKP